jgi:hypothetical protein
VLKLHGITDKKYRCIIAYHVAIPFAGVKFQRETAGITPGVRAAAFAGHRGKPDQRFDIRIRLKHRSFGKGTDYAKRLIASWVLLIIYAY